MNPHSYSSHGLLAAVTFVVSASLLRAQDQNGQNQAQQGRQNENRTQQDNTALGEIVIDEPTAGTKTATGFIQSGKDAKLVIEVRRGRPKLTIDSVEKVADQNRFDATFRMPLKIGDEVAVTATKGGESKTKTITVPASSDVADWGRVRGKFSLGFIVSEDIDLSDGLTTSFVSKGEPYFDFRVISMWHLPKLREMCCEGPQELRGHFSRLDTGLQITDTPLAVRVPGMSDDGDGMDMNGDMNEEMPMNGDANGDMEDEAMPLDAVASSRSLVVFGDFSMMWPLTQWKHPDKRNGETRTHALNIGWFGRAEFRRLIEELDRGRVLLSNGSRAESGTFPGMMAGFRAGHYKVTDLDNNGAELMSYVDVGVGALSYLNRDVDGNGPNTFSHPRLYFAGRLRIPSLPLEFGAEGNWALGKRENVTIGETTSSVPVLDDLRFFFAATFDIGSLLSIVSSAGSPSTP